MLVTIPERPSGALTGSEFAKKIENLSGWKREAALLAEYEIGNVPDFLRRLADVTVSVGENHLTYTLLPDYLCVGSDDDYFRTPLAPVTAQKIADLYHCQLPTRKMVHDIWQKSPVKVGAKNLPPNLKPPNHMTGTPYYVKHSKLIDSMLPAGFVPGTLVGGHKKDVVVTNRLREYPNNVAIYGWFFANGQCIQGLNPKDHDNGYADYSHGIRLISRTAMLNNNPVVLTDIMQDPKLCGLVSDEGVVTVTRYKI